MWRPQPEDLPSVLVNGRPVRIDPAGSGPTGPKVGDLRSAIIPFSAVRTAKRDRGSTSKGHPALVVELEPMHIAVRAVFGANSATRRTGQGVRLRDWRAAGLRKPSVVAYGVTWIAPNDLGDLIGRLSAED